MDRKTTRILVLAASSAVAALLFWGGSAWIRSRHTGTLEIRRAKMPELPPPAPPAVPAPAASTTPSTGPVTPEEWKYHLTKEQASSFFAFAPDRSVYDPWTFVRPLGGMRLDMPWEWHPNGRIEMDTNSLGMREDHELADPPAEWRVLVAGDSHTNGVCENSESFSNRLEAALIAAHPGRTVEVLNTGCGGYSFFNYLGTWLKFRDFHPQVFVVVAYAGNDFAELLGPLLYFERRNWGPTTELREERRTRALRASPDAMGQGLDSYETFRHWPQEKAAVLAKAVELCLEMRDFSAAAGCRFVFACLPGAFDVRWAEPTEAVLECEKILAMTPAEEQCTKEMAHDLLDALRAKGVTTVELQPLFEAEPLPPYWRHDYHLDLRGHVLVAQALMPVVDETLTKR